MSPEKEEILTDPGNHAVIKFLAGVEQKNLQETAENIGIDEQRLRKKSRLLENHGFLKRNHSTDGIRLELERESLEEARREIKQFMENHSSKMDVKAVEERKDLEKLREQLEERKEETKVVKRQKKFENRIKSVNQVLDKLESCEDSLEKFDAFSHSHRIQRFLGSREENFHGFNPGRKVKALDRLDEVLRQEPEEREPRRFFGNRWVTQK